MSLNITGSIEKSQSIVENKATGPSGPIARDLKICGLVKGFFLWLLGDAVSLHVQTKKGSQTIYVTAESAKKALGMGIADRGHTWYLGIGRALATMLHAVTPPNPAERSEQTKVDSLKKDFPDYQRLKELHLTIPKNWKGRKIESPMDKQAFLYLEFGQTTPLSR